LNRALSRVIGIVPVKTTLPILSNIRLQADQEFLQLTASDLNVTITTRVNIEGLSDGSLTVPSKPFHDLVKNLPNIPLHIESDAQNKIHIRCDKGDYRISGETDDDYPALPHDDDKGYLKIDSKQFARMISKTVFAVSSDPLRVALTGVMMQVNNNDFKMVATDGHRLSKISYKKFETSIVDPMDIIVSNKALNEVAKESRDMTTIVFGEHHVQFDIGHTKIYSRILEETYPDYERVIPVDNDKLMLVETATLIDAFKRVSIFSNPITHQIQLQFSQKGLIITAEDIDGGNTATENIPVEYKGEPLNIGYNSNLVISVLNNVDTKELKIEFKNPTSAGVIAPIEQLEHEHQMFLIMPVRINK
jgi:DNA polymerase-3 subunit beta